MRRIAYATLFLLAGCEKPTPTPAPCPPPAEPALVTEPPPMSTLTRRPLRSVDAAAGPDGKLWVAAVVDEPGRAKAKTFVWDPTTARVVDDSQRTLLENDKVDLGEPVALHLAIAKSRAFVVRETARDLVTLFNFQGGIRDEIHGGRDTSLAVSESHVALSLVARPGRLTVKLYGADESTPVTTDIADATPPSTDRAARRSAIAFAGEKLFVLHRDAPDRVRVTELDVPSLKPGRSYTRPSPRRAVPAKLIADGSRLFLFDAGVLTELTPDLQVARERSFDADDVALGPSGELLSPTGLGAGRYADVVPALGAPAACTPTWLGSQPLLACRLDGESSRVVRVRE